jgi:TatD DNase family protein
MMGLHPCSVKKDFEKELYVVESWLTKRKFVAIGEMGTDLYWDKTFWEEQVEAFTYSGGVGEKI